MGCSQSKSVETVTIAVRFAASDSAQQLVMVDSSGTLLLQEVQDHHHVAKDVKAPKVVDLTATSSGQVRSSLGFYGVAAWRAAVRFARPQQPRVG
jgi:hypothetical protein